MGCIHYNVIGVSNVKSFPVIFDSALSSVLKGVRCGGGMNEKFIFAGGSDKLTVFTINGKRFDIAAQSKIIDVELIEGTPHALGEKGELYKIHTPVNDIPYVGEVVDTGVIKVVNGVKYKVTGYAYSDSEKRIVPILNEKVLNVCDNGCEFYTDGTNSRGVALDGVINGYDVNGKSYYLTVDRVLFEVEGTSQPRVVAQNVIDIGKSGKDRVVRHEVFVPGTEEAVPQDFGIGNSTHDAIYRQLAYFVKSSATWYGSSSRKEDEYIICDGKKIFTGYWKLNGDGTTGSVRPLSWSWGKTFGEVLWYMTDDGKTHEIGSTRTFVRNQDLKSSIVWSLQYHDEILGDRRKAMELIGHGVHLGIDGARLEKI